MKKKLTTRQFAAIKRVYKNVCSSIETREKNLAKIVELEEENKGLDAFIDANETGVKMLTDGIPSEALVKKVVEETDKITASGKFAKVTKFIPTDIVEYDEEEGCYYINEPDVDRGLNSVEEIDDTEKATIKEEKPSDEEAFDPTKIFTEEDAKGIPFEE